MNADLKEIAQQNEISKENASNQNAADPTSSAGSLNQLSPDHTFTAGAVTGTTSVNGVSPSQAMKVERTMSPTANTASPSPAFGSGYPPSSTYAVPVPPSQTSAASGIVVSASDTHFHKPGDSISGWGGRPALDPINPIYDPKKKIQETIPKSETQPLGHIQP